MLALLARPLIIYGLSAILALGLLGGLYGKGRSDGRASERTAWEATVADMKAKSADLLAAKIVEIAAIEHDRELLNTKISKDLADAREETDAALVDFNRRAGILMRKQTCIPANSAPGNSQAVGAERNTELATPALVLDSEVVRNLGLEAANNQRTESVMVACKSWALSVGR